MDSCRDSARGRPTAQFPEAILLLQVGTRFRWVKTCFSVYAEALLDVGHLLPGELYPEWC